MVDSDVNVNVSLERTMSFPVESFTIVVVSPDGGVTPFVKYQIASCIEPACCADRCGDGVYVPLGAYVPGVCHQVVMYPTARNSVLSVAGAWVYW